LGRNGDIPLTVDDVSKKVVEKILKETAPMSTGFLPEEETNKIMAAYGLPVLSMGLARSPQEAVEFAAESGYPVVLKIASPEIPHKSDIGGVLLNLESAEDVNEGYAALMKIAEKVAPRAKVMGVYVQSMVTAGQEVILGAVHDPQFGPLIMFGSGGVEVEGLEDVSFALAPATQQEIGYLLNSTWAGKKLRGFRSLPPADKNAVEDALVRLGQLASDFPQIGEIEINPLRVQNEGQGAVAVDVRIKLT
jgi:acetyltransferase